MRLDQKIKDKTTKLMTIIMIVVAMGCLASCSSDDDDNKEETRLYVALKDGTGSRISGYVFVFPSATDYDPYTFVMPDGMLSTQATVNRTDGSVVKSISYIPCTKEELGVWYHYDKEPSQKGLTSCKPGIYYVIAAQYTLWTPSWLARTITIKEGSNLETFEFHYGSGYLE